MVLFVTGLVTSYDVRCRPVTKQLFHRCILFYIFFILFKKTNNKQTTNNPGCGCNKVIMIITDGASENAEEVFRKHNWENGRSVRVFTFLIGRDQTDHTQVQWMACANDGKFFHVATIADVNEHVHEYIPVLSRPMALTGHHETTWSNVFVGHLDKELKIAVARPAFKTKESLMNKVDMLERDDQYYKDLLADFKAKANQAKTQNEQQSINDNYLDQIMPDDDDYYKDYYADGQQQFDQQYNYDNYGEYGNSNGPAVVVQKAESSSNNILKTTTPPSVTSLPLTNQKIDQEDDEKTDEERKDEELIKLLKHTDEALRDQQVLLGVVGVDVPVLRLISKVSPKYQMGVGIYIIMLDNNGFIVFHPSIRKEISTTSTDYKGKNNSNYSFV
jgi:hypothetical protein